ncbi:I13R1 protein, partial [Casuarius casuarius]|nr:I13R1 protein [Casuarius casuarius]
TAATDLDCVWHNLEYMDCKWLAGKKARSDTEYALFYWYDGLESPKKCNNYSVHEGIFECIFNLTFPTVSNTYPTISILIKDDSEEIRPLCESKNPTTLVKPATPKAVTLSKISDAIHLEWSESDTFPANCLYYEVEYHSGDPDTAQTIKVTFRYLQLPVWSCLSFIICGNDHSNLNSLLKNDVDPNTKYTFKVRAKPKSECYSSKLCSDWSEEKSIGEKPDSTFYFVLIITVPIIVAVSTIILLFYLKRLKILILPPIPDPREILKRMFGEQTEDSQVSASL